MSSSSQREVHPCEAVLERHESKVGPMRLPIKNRLRFVEEFNRRYRSTGLAIRTVTAESDTHESES